MKDVSIYDLEKCRGYQNLDAVLALCDAARKHILSEYANILMQGFILMIPFQKASEELQVMSTHGGDEDFIVLMPPDFDEDPPGFHSYYDATTFRLRLGKQELPFVDIRIYAH